jgi:glutamine synthetase
MSSGSTCVSPTPKGKWQHLTMCAGVLGEDELEDGLMFDGSSIEGWKAINESDMILRPIWTRSIWIRSAQRR